MWKKIAVAGGVGAAVLGVGAAALAETGSTAGSATPSASASASPSGANGSSKHAGKHAGKRLNSLEHGEWVSRDGTTNVTHDVVHGKVTAVSATSISVQASDGYRLTFVVNGDTKVRARPAGSTDKKAGTTATIAAVKVGDTALVSGTKSGSAVTAKHVIDTGTS